MDKLFKINPLDNVYVVRQTVEEGETMVIDGRVFTSKKTLGLGHKVAACAIPFGKQVIKFGIPIGSATEDIRFGDHVHLHNLKSDYIPTYTLDHEFIKP
ncbi:UxaA family hydrolase [Dyadobacter bucti]|uniref:UxaA family hydrolase n=1 Tax=Dyadobacter bucti TaxID=2572203 RepID=UPI001109F83A|nr:UxaA family hydrolase [Dyadobacter bucti]